jgi:hypothetical protein
MDWKKVGAKLAEVGLPLLGTLLGPVGTAGGGLAGNLIASVLGKDPESITPGDMIEAIQNPEILVKLKQIESDNEIELKRLALRAEEIRLADVADARKMHTDTTKATGKRDANIYVLSYLFIIGFFVVMIVILYFAFTGKGFDAMPTNAVLLVGILITALTARLESITQFFFGSSQGSKEKDKTMDRVVMALSNGSGLAPGIEK